MLSPPEMKICTSENLKTKTWTLSLVHGFTWKLEFVTNILWMIADPSNWVKMLQKLLFWIFTTIFISGFDLFGMSSFQSPWGVDRIFWAQHLLEGTIRDALRTFVPSVQFLKSENHPWRSVFLVKLQLY